MRLNIYGRFQLEVRRENESWEVYRPELGKRAKLNDVVIPSSLDADEIVTYLDDLFHELSGPGQRIELLP
jgi:predicted HAD superfamily phosphohydrolase